MYKVVAPKQSKEKNILILEWVASYKAEQAKIKI